MQPEQVMEQNGCHLSLLEGKLQPTQRAARLACLQTHCIHWHFLCFFSLPLGGGGHLLWAWAGGHHCYTTEGQRQEPRKEGRLFTNNSVYWTLRWCLAVIFHGSLRALL